MFELEKQRLDANCRVWKLPIPRSNIMAFKGNCVSGYIVGDGGRTSGILRREADRQAHPRNISMVSRHINDCKRHSEELVQNAKLGGKVKIRKMNS